MVEQGWKRTRYPLHGTQAAAVNSFHLVSPSAEITKSTMEKSPMSTQAIRQIGIDASFPVQHHPSIDNEKTQGGSTSTRQSSVSSSSVSHFHREATTTPDGTERLQAPPSPTEQSGARTLRRSPKSRRFEAHTEPSDSRRSTSPAQSTDDAVQKDTGSAHIEGSNWHRAEHPLQGNAKDSTETPQIKPSSTPSAAVHGGSTVRQAEQAGRTLPASPPDSESEVDSPHQQNIAQKNHRSQSSEKTSKWHRRGYPLQTLSNHVDVRRPLTPPSADEDTKQATTRTNDSKNEVARTGETKSSPAQAPASAPSGSSAEPAKDHTEAPALSQVAKPRAVPQKKSLRRQRYPLQSPASITDLKAPSPTPLPTNPTTDRAQLMGRSEQNQGPAVPSQKRLRRQMYPLQSPASAADLKHTLSTSSPVPTAENKNSVPSASDASSHRPTYPLQSPASTYNVPTSSLASERHDPTSTEQSQQVDRNQESPFHSFRRRQYPLQSSANSGTHQDSPVPSRASSVTAVSDRGAGHEANNYFSPPPSYAPDTQRSKEGETPKVLLPKNLRAVNDAEKPLRGRTVVICLDGTGDKFDDDNSNIVHLVSALKKDDPNQVTYYQAGIGTYNSGGLSTGFEAAMDMAVGSGLGLHIRDAYRFLMHSYKEGDRVCIFGFSRGAYTARCLAGMIHKVGLLPPRNIQQINFAYDFYKQDTEQGWKQSADFKRAFCIDINIHFLGCFDSVASVGFIPRQLPLSSTPTSKARHFRHAMALDERRAKFKICRYQSAKKQGELDVVELNSEGTKLLGKTPHVRGHSQNDTPPQYSATEPYGKKSHHNLTDEEFDRIYSHDDEFDTDVKEVWFAGCHADVGGGAVANVERHKLAQIPLRWMIRQAFECNTGIIFKTRFLAEYGLDVHTLWPKYQNLNVPSITEPPPSNFLSKYDKDLPPREVRRGKLMPVSKSMSEHNENDKHHHHEPLYQLNSQTDEDWTPEQVEDYYDAMSPMNDQLVQAPTWWILEMLPVQYKMSPQPGQVVVHTGPNMGLARLVEEHEANIHWTVLQRARKMEYKAAARPAKHTEWKVVT